MKPSRSITNSVHKEATIEEYLDMSIMTLTLAKDTNHVGRYPMMVMSVALDGRNLKGCEDSALKHFAIAIKDDFNSQQKFELIGARRSGKNDREGPVFFDDQKLKRLVSSGKIGEKNKKS